MSRMVRSLLAQTVLISSLLGCRLDLSYSPRDVSPEQRIDAAPDSLAAPDRSRDLPQPDQRPPCRVEKLAVKRAIAGGSSFDDWGQAVAVEAGRVYATGHWGVYPIQDSSVFFTDDVALSGEDAKRAPVHFPSAYSLLALGSGLALSPDGQGKKRVYLVGSFESTIEFDTKLTAPHGSFVAVSELSLSGQRTGWAGYDQKLEGQGSAIAVDPSGNVYLAGSFHGPAFEGTGCSKIATTTDPGDVFVAKYDSALRCQWAIQMGGKGEDKGQAIAYQGGKLYVAGSYVKGFAVNGTSCGQPSNDDNDNAFLVKLDPVTQKCEGLWTFAQSPFARAYALAARQDALYLAGQFKNEVTVSTHPSRSLKASCSSTTDCRDMFLAKASPAQPGEWLWALRAGGPEPSVAPAYADNAYALAIGQDNRLYLAGASCGAVTVGEPESASPAKTVPGKGGTDAFVAVFDPQGQVLFAETYGGPTEDEARGMAVDGCEVHVTGKFSGTASFGSKTLHSVGGSGVLLLHLCPDCKP